MANKNQVFVKIDEYKEILDIIDLFKKKIEETKTTINEINEIKKQEDDQLKEWNSNLDEIEKKLSMVDKTLFEGQN